MSEKRGYEKCWDLAFGKEYGEEYFSRGFVNFASIVVGFAFKVLFRYRIDHREKVTAFKGKTGVVVVCNHTSYLDTIFLFLSMWPHMYPRIIARDTLYEGKPYIAQWVLAHVGTFPIKRDSADRKAIKRAATMLKRKEPVCLLPEGTRRGKGSQEPQIHGGAALIARMGKAPIVPLTVRNAEDVKRKGERMHFPKITLEFGDPILVSDFDFLPKEQRLEGCTWYAMRECFALSKRIPADEVDMVALFPHGTDYTEVFKEHPVPHHTSEELAARYDDHANVQGDGE